MPRRRTPLQKARLTGAAAKHPERYAQRREPETSGPLGDPPGWLTDAERGAWRAFERELPWLVQSDRAALGAACALRSRIEARKAVSASDFREFRMVLTALGATPTSRSNVSTPQDGDDDKPLTDIEQRYFS